ncbi:conserved hypothetical protein [Theileria orientalis strain Shintoku]|uniref:RNA-editing substrate-binding complex 6 protein domain-containing protein n=1 Tax=Theileria orientalis strain Shintoku TaxID=869250 RepID=J4DPH3_THEOR|nr:conserved hypothetical protein [Theileria orientalis strain Shintoku]BAM40704.1 conserved hypothetical protein [Theileria orientalis strain Shintoku]|eukprot:XP_009691005.1 conserved hypothetical protein [Theileria orientalis strain Shintoku]
MKTIKNQIFNNFKNISPSEIPFLIKKCIYQGFTFPDDLKFFSEKTYQYIDEFKLLHITSLLHSFSIPIYRNFQLFTTLSNRIRNQLKVESPSVEQSIKIINSCGRLHYSDSELIETLVGIVKANIETITTKNLVSILHSLTKLRFPDVELLSSLSLVAAKGLEEISDVALANLTIATSKIHRSEFTGNAELLENGRKLMSQLLPEIKSRSSTSSPLDNLRHVIALSNMKHLITSELDLKECLDKLLRFINCSVLYYEHLILLFECVKTLNYTNEDFVFDNLVPSLLNKRTEHNATAEFDLRLLKCLSGTGNLSRSSEFLLDQVLENLSKKIWRHPKLIKHAFNLVNTTEADPTPFLKGLQEYLERSNKQLDSGATAEIKSSMQRSKEEWNKLELLIESSITLKQLVTRRNEHSVARTNKQKVN